MHRTQKYDVTESLASFASSQQTIISHTNDINNHRSENIYDSTGVPKRKKKVPTGWLIAGVFSAISISFLLCVYFLRIPGVPESSTFVSNKLLQERGYLKIYPFLPNENAPIPGMYRIPLPINNSLLDQMDDVINNYPENSDNYRSCFVASPAYNEPCVFEKNWLGEKCTRENQFGYLEQNGMYNPCIIIQIADSFDWIPIIYKEKDVDESWRNIYDPTFASIGCAIKRTENTKEIQSIDIFPEKGFPTHFFPITNFNSSLYLPPSVMIQINNIKVGDNVTVECWLRAMNAYLLVDSGQIIISFVQNEVESKPAVAFNSTSEKFQPTFSHEIYNITSPDQLNVTNETITTTESPNLILKPKN